MALDEARWNQVIRLIRILLILFDWLFLPWHHFNALRNFFDTIFFPKHHLNIVLATVLVVSCLSSNLFIYATW